MLNTNVFLEAISILIENQTSQTDSITVQTVNPSDYRTSNTH